MAVTHHRRSYANQPHYLLSRELDTETIRKAMSQTRGELTPDD
ncbi:hypothetical protein ACLK17_08780 [Escherichia coli]